MVKKAFTLIEMLIVIVIIAILAAALIPKLTASVEKAKDKKSLTAVRDFLIAQQAGNNSYPLHSEDFSKKPYLVDKGKDGTPVTSIVTTNFKLHPADWGKGAWVYIYDTEAAKIEGEEANKFLKQILSKISSKDIAQLTWNDNQVVAIWFFWNLAKILDKYKSIPGVQDAINTLKQEWFTYIDKPDVTNPAKAVWGGFVLWLDRTPWNGGVKISENQSDLISENEELKDRYVNFAFVNDNLYFISDLLSSEEERRWFITAMLKAIKDSGVSITDLTAGK